MKHTNEKAIVLDTNDIRSIIAHHFNVKESNVIKSQYSWTVVTESSDKNKNDIKQTIAYIGLYE